MHTREAYRVNQDPGGIIPHIRHFALDMDGTVYLEDVWLDGALDFLHHVEAAGCTYCFMTNNSSKDRAMYVEKLHRMGLDIDPDRQLVTSGDVTIAYIKKHYPGKRIFLLGTQALMGQFEAAGICLDRENPDVLVSAFDTSFDYNVLWRFCDLVREGYPYISTHPDINCPTKNGFMPDVGAIHAYVKASTGRMPDKIVGKPSREMIDYVLDIAGTRPDETAAVGDRLDTDIKSGVQNGLHSILVLSGVTKLTDLAASDVRPELIFDSVKELIPFF